MIVMISGKQGSGKTTTSDNLRQFWGSRGIACWQYKFAQPLYEMHDVVYIVANQYGIEKPDRKDGDLLQVLGTEWGRAKNKNIWIDCAKAKIEKVTARWRELNLFHIVLIDDLRFENEFDAFPDALKIRLDCFSELRQARASYWRKNTDHPSETGLDQYAADGKFHLTVDTDKLSAPEVTKQITDFFQDKVNAAFKR